MKKTELVGLKIDKEMMEKLQEIAKEKEWSIPHVIRNILQKELKIS